MYDVLVVGGGPAGCYTASLLSLKGLNVHVIEEHAVIGEPVDCSGVIGAEAYEKLELPESLKLGAISNLTLVSPSQLEIKFSPPSPLAYVVNRAAFDRVIGDRTLKSGVHFHFDCRVIDLDGYRDHIEVTVEGTNNEQRSTVNQDRLRARVVILAGGPRYNLQQKLGMGQPSNFLRTAQAEVPIRNINEARILLGSQVAPGSFAWIAPFQKGSGQFARIGVSAKTTAGPFLRRWMRELSSKGHMEACEAPIRSWVIPIAPIRCTFADRVLAVGDAAGQTKPTTGGGIYYGLLGAKAAAKVVGRAFKKGDFSSRMLQNYEKGWRKHVGTEIRIGAYFRRLFERLTDKEVDDLFRVVQSDGILAAVTQKARFDWHRDIIYFTLRHPELGRIFLRGLFR